MGRLSVVANLETAIEIARGVRERAVRFPVSGEEIAGNLVLPADSREVCAVFLHGWSGIRSGPHDLLTRLARSLGESGIPSLRFDFRGRGESTGDGLALDLISMADDAAAAAEFARRETGARRVVMVGMCSGGNVAIGVLPRVSGVAGLVLLSVYPFSDADAFSRDVHRMWHYLRVYWMKARQPETWRRLLRGEVHIGRVLDVLFGHFFRRRGASDGVEQDEQRSGEQPRPVPRATATDPGREQWGEQGRRHLNNLLCGAPALMIYGSADPDAAAAEAYYRGFAEEHGLPIRFEWIEGANHNFSSEEWTRRVDDLVREFVLGVAAGSA